MHKVVIEVRNYKTKELIETKTEEFFSIYNAERRLFDVECEIVEQEELRRRYQGHYDDNCQSVEIVKMGAL